MPKEKKSIVHYSDRQTKYSESKEGMTPISGKVTEEKLNSKLKEFGKVGNAQIIKVYSAITLFAGAIMTIIWYS